MTGTALTIFLIGMFAVGAVAGFSAASFAYARRYRALAADVEFAARFRPAYERLHP